MHIIKGLCQGANLIIGGYRDIRHTEIALCHLLSAALKLDDRTGDASGKLQAEESDKHDTCDAQDTVGDFQTVERCINKIVGNGKT